MTNIHALVLYSVTSALTVSAVFITIGGFNYMDPEIGHGLHPAIAFPLAMIAIAIPIPLVKWMNG